MAKVTKIICDKCMADIPSAFVVLKEHSEADSPPVQVWEYCKPCWLRLEIILSAPEPFTTPIAPDEVIKDMETKKVVKRGLEQAAAREFVPAPEVKVKKKPGRPKKAQAVKQIKPGDLLDSEMVIVKSNFNMKKAEKANSAMRGTCEHLFKSFEEGQTVCSDAPPGAKGPFASFKGCGKRLKDFEL